jgi:uncharacterized membrane protein HdeD (DUF308 family)
VSGAAPPPGSSPFETFQLAVILGVVVGTVAVVLPLMNVLAAATAAIAFAAGVRGTTRTLRARWFPEGLGPWAAGTSVVGGVAGFVLLPAPWSVARGLVLTVSFVPWLRFARGGRAARRARP